MTQASYLRVSAILAKKQRRCAKENTGVSFFQSDAGKQIRLNKDKTRLLFRKSDKVLLEFKCDEQEVTPSRGVRLDNGNIADFCYSGDSKFIYIITDDGVLHFRSKNLDKDYVIDKSTLISSQRANILAWLFLTVESIWHVVQTSVKRLSPSIIFIYLNFKELGTQYFFTRSVSSPIILRTG